MSFWLSWKEPYFNRDFQQISTEQETQEPPSHELEIELKHPTQLLQSVSAASQQSSSQDQYVEGSNRVLEHTVQTMVNTLRSLNRLPGGPRDWMFNKYIDIHEEAEHA